MNDTPASRNKVPSGVPAETTGVPATADCWDKIGVSGDRSCADLEAYIHCRNCPVYAKAALQLLSLLQKEARFIDFTQESMSQYSDADIGAVARVVHEGCRKVLRQHFELAPVREEEEGKRITLAKGYDASSVRITGNIVGQAPFSGTLVHRGWKTTEIKLPKITEGHDVNIIAAAEVEL